MSPHVVTVRLFQNGGIYLEISNSNKSMGKAQRDDLYNTGKVPGPGAYAPDSKINGPKYHFGGRHAQSVTELVPGPGQYTPDLKLRHKLTTFRYSMAGRPSTENNRNASPGPGAYDSMGNLRRTGVKFGKDEKKGLVLTHNLAVPGPGAYDFNKKASSSVHASPKFTYFYKLYLSFYSFGLKTPDCALYAGRGVPGPGTYNLKNAVGSEGTRLTILPRRPDSAPSYGRNAPGPGAYTPGFFKNAPAYRIGTQQRGKLAVEALKVPGPGAYNPGDRTVSYRQNTPGWGYFYKQ